MVSAAFFDRPKEKKKQSKKHHIKPAQEFEKLSLTF